MKKSPKSKVAPQPADDAAEREQAIKDSSGDDPPRRRAPLVQDDPSVSPDIRKAWRRASKFGELAIVREAIALREAKLGNDWKEARALNEGAQISSKADNEATSKQNRANASKPRRGKIDFELEAMIDEILQTDPSLTHKEVLKLVEAKSGQAIPEAGFKDRVYRAKKKIRK
jgi:hypothetical protein